MSDEQRRRPQDGPGDHRPLDETSQFDPFVDDPDVVPPPGADATRPMAAADDTRPVPRTGDVPTAPFDRTAPMDQTRAMPAVTDDAGAAWSGRAEVRTPPPVPPDATAVGGWAPVAAEPPSRRWWLPILVGVAALLLVGLVGAGVYALTSGGDDDPAPVASAPAAAPTSVAPTTESPSPEPTTPSPTPEEQVSVPEVVGLTSAEARRALDDAGLTYRLRFRESDEEPGTVLDSRPSVGEQVEPGSRVELIIARAEPTTAPTTATPSPSETGPQEPED
jgi:hypothetical protein